MYPYPYMDSNTPTHDPYGAYGMPHDGFSPLSRTRSGAHSGHTTPPNHSSYHSSIPSRPYPGSRLSSVVGENRFKMEDLLLEIRKLKATIETKQYEHDRAIRDLVEKLQVSEFKSKVIVEVCLL